MKTVKLVFELDKEEIAATCFLLKAQMTDELWNELIEKEIVITKEDLEGMGDKAVSVSIAMSALALSKMNQS